MTFPSIIFSAPTTSCSLTSHYFGYAIEVSGSSRFGTAARTKRSPVSVSSKLGVCQVIMSTLAVLSPSKPSNAYAPVARSGFFFPTPRFAHSSDGGVILNSRVFSVPLPRLSSLTPAHPPRTGKIREENKRDKNLRQAGRCKSRVKHHEPTDNSDSNRSNLEHSR